MVREKEGKGRKKDGRWLSRRGKGEKINEGKEEGRKK